MISLMDGETLCRSVTDIPEAARGLVEPKIENQLGETLAELFPQFAATFPRSSQAIEEHFGPLVLIYRFNETRDRWYQRCVAEGESSNLVFDIHGRHTPPDRNNFDEDLAMLPTGWRELYRWFGGFGIQSPVSLRRFAHLLPTPVHGRMDLEQFLTITKIYFSDYAEIDEETASDFIDNIASAHPFANGRRGEVRCWCLCRDGDSLWISDQDRQQNVDLVPRFRFEQSSVVENPIEYLDAYMATVLIAARDDDIAMHPDSA